MKHNKRLIVLRLIAIVLCLMFITSKYITKTLAKYTSSDFASDSARVATFFIGSDDTKAPISFSINNMKAGDTLTYDFAIVNYTGDKLTETAYTYNFSVSTLGNLPLTITVSQNSKSGTGEFATIDPVSKTSGVNGTMDCNTKSSHTYTITITWDKNELDYKYTQEVDMLIINYTCTQVD